MTSVAGTWYQDNAKFIERIGKCCLSIFLEEFIMDWCYFFFKYWIEFLCQAIFPKLFFLTTYIFSFLRQVPRGGIAGPYAKYILNYGV